MNAHFYAVALDRDESGPALESSQETVGQRIRRLREAHGWSQEDLARRIGRTSSSVYRLESDKTRLKGDGLARAAEAFSVSVDYLVTGRDWEPPPTGPNRIPNPVVVEFIKRRAVPPKLAAKLLAIDWAEWEPTDAVLRTILFDLEDQYRSDSGVMPAAVPEDVTG